MPLLPFGARSYSEEWVNYTLKNNKQVLLNLSDILVYDISQYGVDVAQVEEMLTGNI